MTIGLKGCDEPARPCATRRAGDTLPCGGIHDGGSVAVLRGLRPHGPPPLRGSGPPRRTGGCAGVRVRQVGVPFRYRLLGRTAALSPATTPLCAGCRPRRQGRSPSDPVEVVRLPGLRPRSLGPRPRAWPTNQPWEGEPLHWALRYVAAGLPVVPLCWPGYASRCAIHTATPCPHPGKRPFAERLAANPLRSVEAVEEFWGVQSLAGSRVVSVGPGWTGGPGRGVPARPTGADDHDFDTTAVEKDLSRRRERLRSFPEGPATAKGVLRLRR